MDKNGFLVVVSIVVGSIVVDVSVVEELSSNSDVVFAVVLLISVTPSIISGVCPATNSTKSGKFTTESSSSSWCGAIMINPLLVVVVVEVVVVVVVYFIVVTFSYKFSSGY